MTTTMAGATAGMQGADTDGLRTFASMLDDSTTTLLGWEQRLGQALRQCAWKGSDAARFTCVWQQRLAAQLRAVAQACGDAADQIRREVDEQERASAVTATVGSGLRTALTAAALGATPTGAPRQDSTGQPWFEDFMPWKRNVARAAGLVDGVAAETGKPRAVSHRSALARGLGLLRAPLFVSDVIADRRSGEGWAQAITSQTVGYAAGSLGSAVGGGTGGSLGGSIAAGLGAPQAIPAAGGVGTAIGAVTGSMVASTLGNKTVDGIWRHPTDPVKAVGVGLRGLRDLPRDVGKDFVAMTDGVRDVARSTTKVLDSGSWAGPISKPVNLNRLTKLLD